MPDSDMPLDDMAQSRPTWERKMATTQTGSKKLLTERDGDRDLNVYLHICDDARLRYATGDMA